MPYSWAVPMGDGRVAQIVSTTSREGSFAVPAESDLVPADLIDSRSRIVAGPWSWFRQVHGSVCVEVTQPGMGAGSRADGGITVETGCVIGVTTADCAPVVLVSTVGIAVLHCGWRGAAAGIIQDASERLRLAGGTPVATVLGPCIGPAQYEFGADELDLLVDSHGASVVGETWDAKPALDMHGLVTSCCQEAGWPSPAWTECTSADWFFSHRCRSDRGRQATVGWIDDERSGLDG